MEENISITVRFWYFSFIAANAQLVLVDLRDYPPCRHPTIFLIDWMAQHSFGGYKAYPNFYRTKEYFTLEGQKPLFHLNVTRNPYETLTRELTSNIRAENTCFRNSSGSDDNQVTFGEARVDSGLIAGSYCIPTSKPMWVQRFSKPPRGGSWAFGVYLDDKVAAPSITSSP